MYKRDKDLFIVVTKNQQGQIVAVTEQDADGQILEVIDESSKVNLEQIPLMDWEVDNMAYEVCGERHDWLYDFVSVVEKWHGINY